MAKGVEVVCAAAVAIVGIGQQMGLSQNLSPGKYKLCEKCRIQPVVIPSVWDITNEGRPRGEA